MCRLPTSRRSTVSSRSGPTAGRRERTYRVRPHQDARPDPLDRHAAADGQRQPAPRQRCSATLQTDSHRPLPAHARARGLLSDGLGRQRPADRAPGAELLRRHSATRRLPYDPDFTPPAEPPQGRPVASAGRNFVELCERLTAEDEDGVRAPVADARPVGRLVADLHDDRATASGGSSQRAFLRNLARGEAYTSEAPTLWDVDYQTAVSQAELEDREQPRRVPPHRVPPGPTATVIFIETTRPELIPSCVALVAHPDDERYQPLFGTEVTHAAVRRRGPGRRPPRSPIPRRARASP